MEVKYKTYKNTLIGIDVLKIDSEDIVDSILKIDIPAKVDGVEITNVCFSVDLRKFSEMFSTIEYCFKGNPQRISGMKIFSDRKKEILKFPSSIASLQASAFKSHWFETIDFSKALKLKKLPENCFNNCLFETKVVLPSNLKTIRYSCFEKCIFKKGIVFNEGLEIIERTAFKEAKLNNKITKMPDSLKEIGRGAFFASKSIREVFFSKNSSLENLSDLAFASSKIIRITLNSPKLDLSSRDGIFKNCSYLKEANLSNLIATKKIPTALFNLCHLKKIQFPSQLEEIETAAFRNHDLSSLNFPPTLKKIGYCCFENNQIESINFEGLEIEEIGDYAFRSNRIKEIPCNFFENIKNLGMGIFSYNYFSEITIFPPLNDITLNGTFFNNSFLKKIVFKNSKLAEWRKIDSCIVGNCSDLKEIDTPSTVTSLEDHCFVNTGIEHFISSTIETIEDSVFYGCRNLKTFDVKNSPLKTIGNSVFYNCSSLENVFFPIFFSDNKTDMKLPSTALKNFKKENPFFEI